MRHIAHCLRMPAVTKDLSFHHRSVHETTAYAPVFASQLWFRLTISERPGIISLLIKLYPVCKRLLHFPTARDIMCLQNAPQAVPGVGIWKRCTSRERTSPRRTRQVWMRQSCLKVPSYKIVTRLSQCWGWVVWVLSIRHATCASPESPVSVHSKR